jgi:hypothetical protein
MNETLIDTINTIASDVPMDAIEKMARILLEADNGTGGCSSYG